MRYALWVVDAHPLGPSTAGAVHERTMVPPGCRLPLSLRTSAHAGVVTAGNAFGAIRFPLLRPVSVPATKERTDCHVATLLAMTGGGRTLAAQNDHLSLFIHTEEVRRMVFAPAGSETKL